MKFLFRILQVIKTFFVYKLIFKKIGIRSIIKNPLKIEGGKNILIGNRVSIAYKVWLAGPCRCRRC